jgi:hypothetical protein
MIRAVGLLILLIALELMIEGLQPLREIADHLGRKEGRIPSSVSDNRPGAATPLRRLDDAVSPLPDIPEPAAAHPAAHPLQRDSRGEINQDLFKMPAGYPTDAQPGSSAKK